MIGYCMKCKVKREMKNPTHKKNMWRGTCVKCGTKMVRFGK